MLNNSNKFPVFNMTLPKDGPVCIPRFLDFTTALSIEVDFSENINNGWVDFISGVYIDNSDNAETITIVCSGTNQSITFPAGACGYLPLLLTNPAKLTVTASAVGTPIFAHFYNVPMLPFLYPTTLSNGGGGGSGDITAIAGNAIVGANLPVTVQSPTITEYALTLTGGDDAAIIAGQASQYLIIQNPIGNGDITINISGNDASVSGIVLIGGGSIELSDGIQGSINIAGTNGENVVIFGGE